MSTITVAYPVTAVPRADADAFADCLNRRLAYDLGADPSDCTVTVIFQDGGQDRTFRFNLPQLERLIANPALIEAAPDFVETLTTGLRHLTENGQQYLLG